MMSSPGDPVMLATQALRKSDRAELSRLFDAYPQLLRVPHPHSSDKSFLWSVVLGVIRNPTVVSTNMYRWIESLGADLPLQLNRSLLGAMSIQPEEVQALLDSGADPQWLPENGITVLEHAAYRYWNGQCVDLIAARVQPRQSFWMGAALDDLPMMMQYVDRDGALSDSARRNRPDFAAMSSMPSPTRPDATDLEIKWEAFMLACMNHRPTTMDALLQLGVPIDYAQQGMNMLHWAVGNGRTDVAITLLERGANPDCKLRPTNSTAREMVTEFMRESPNALLFAHVHALMAKSDGVQ